MGFFHGAYKYEVLQKVKSAFTRTQQKKGIFSGSRIKVLHCRVTDTV